MPELKMRRYRDTDRADLALICLRTGNLGQDATGIFQHDSLLGDVYALPYVERDPHLAFVVATEAEDRAVGYVIATDDTDAFNAWFARTWWPTVSPTYAGVEAHTKDAALLVRAKHIGQEAEPLANEYPAHLHIDLLPEAQGGGWGRKLITTMISELAHRQVAGVHWTSSAQNEGAVAFYDRLGFDRLPSVSGNQSFGVKFTQE